MIVGTAGHIDHGKTSLVEALTKVDCDRLPAEKIRGMTIDLGFAFLPDLQGEVIGFIDVPGHEKFIRNMLAGATGIDFVLLVVAADDGVMPQTREHIAILDLLGMKNGIAVVTKCDLVDAARRAYVVEEIRSALKVTGLHGISIISASSATGAGIEALRNSILSSTSKLPDESADDRLFRLGVDRVFTLKGIGTVVTGTILSGTVRVDDQIMVSPVGIYARVRSLHRQGSPGHLARVGERAALALTGKDIHPKSIRRGDVILDPALHAPSNRFDATIRILQDIPFVLKQGASIRVHCASAETIGRILPLNARAFAPGDDGMVQIALEKPIAAAVGDRFVIRDSSAQKTLGGGTILDLAPPIRGRKTPSRLAELTALHDMNESDALVTLLSGPRGWVDLNEWCRARCLGPVRSKQLVRDNGLLTMVAAEHHVVFLVSFWHELSQDIGAELDAVHRDEPDLVGVPIEQMRRRIRWRLPAPVFAAAMRQLANESVLSIDRSWLRRPEHKIQFCIEEKQIWLSVQKRLDGDCQFRPPRVRDIAKSSGLDEIWLRRLMRLAARRGEVEEIAHDRFFTMQAIEEMVRVAKSLSENSNDKRFHASEFRDHLGNGRRVAIEILEYFDWHGITSRQGNARLFNPILAANHVDGITWVQKLSGGESLPVGRPDFKSGKG